MSTATTGSTESEVTILARILANERGKLPRDLARYIRELGFSDRDKARMDDLAVRNQADALTPAEKDEMFAFGKAGDFQPGVGQRFQTKWDIVFRNLCSVSSSPGSATSCLWRTAAHACRSCSRSQPHAAASAASSCSCHHRARRGCATARPVVVPSVPLAPAPVAVI